jgi:pyruvate carboxylase subunit B
MDTPDYRAITGDRSFDFTFEDDHVLVDGEPKPYSFEVLRDGYVSLIIDGQSVPVSVESMDEGRMRVTIAGRRTEVEVKDERDLLVDEFGLGDEGAAGGEVRAPMPGLVLEVLVEEGDEVEADQGLLVLEAMKMENELTAPSGGIVGTVHAVSGEAVEKEALLIEIEPVEDES